MARSHGFDDQPASGGGGALDAAGGRIMRDVTRENVGKMMAIILIEKGKPEAISVATIQNRIRRRAFPDHPAACSRRRKPIRWRC
jgi:preprotein translocase subunit SecD